MANRPQLTVGSCVGRIRVLPGVWENFRGRPRMRLAAHGVRTPASGGLVTRKLPQREPGSGRPTTPRGRKRLATCDVDTLRRDTGDTAFQVAPSSTVPEQAADISITIKDIDAGDSDMPERCSEYVKDIYAHLMVLEVQQAVRPGYLKGGDITPHMRALLISWMIMLRSIFHLHQETLYLSVAIFDRFLSVMPVSRKMLQLVGVTAMLLATKYEELSWGGDTPGVRDFANITDNAYTAASIKQMERIMLQSLNFDLGRPLPVHFLRRASKAAGSTAEMHMLANYLMELTLLDYDLVHYRPSEIAAASLFLSQLLLDVDGRSWNPTEQHYTTYDEAHLKPIVRHLAKNVVAVNQGKAELQVVKKKYAGINFMNISLLPELQSPAVNNLAALCWTTSQLKDCLPLCG